jgi:hypothetical protein
MATPQHHLTAARAMIKHNIIQALCADIPAPPEAIGVVHDWEVWGDGYGPMFAAWIRTIGTTKVQILGVQHDDGRIERTIFGEVNDDDGGKTAAQARQIAAAFLEAPMNWTGYSDRRAAPGAR